MIVVVIVAAIIPIAVQMCFSAGMQSNWAATMEPACFPASLPLKVRRSPEGAGRSSMMICCDQRLA